MFELVLRADEALVEPLTEQLIDELNALSASVEDADAEGSAEQPLFGEPGLPVDHDRWPGRQWEDAPGTGSGS